MNRWLIFIGGVLVGVVITLLVLLIIGLSDQRKEHITLFDKPGVAVADREFIVNQIVNDTAVFVNAIRNELGTPHIGDTYLLVNNGKCLNDNQTIVVQEGQIARQIGTYRYVEIDDVIETVPIIKIMNR